MVDCRRNSKHRHRSSLFLANYSKFDYPPQILEDYASIADSSWETSLDFSDAGDAKFDYQNYEAEHHRLRHHRHNGGLVHQDIPWPVKKEAIVEGDIILGGLMMVHERKDNVTCGPVMPQGGIQALEAMLYTLDRLNRDRIRLLPNITLGAHILDDCDKDTYGLEMAVDFIKG
ncbi:Receptor family ligand binding region [Popillia japonica]|uniref:Receptor family ligand binding region n=1 Tax=Popillia japonica TaxID=7064 RepID=A0AAW1MBM6_POPJA